MTLPNVNNWWDSLRHGGLFIAPSRLQQFFAAAPEVLSYRKTERLRRDITSFDAEDSTSRSALLDTLLEHVCDLTGDGMLWRKGKSSVETKWLLRSITGENTKPDRTLDGPNGAFLPVFVTNEPRIGVGRGRRPVSRVLEWLRNAARHVALLTNGRQIRVMYAGLDHDAWVELDTELFFDQGAPGPQVEALRILLSPQSLTPPKAGDPCPLLAAIQDSRKGQSELSSSLGERVRMAVEWLIRSHGASLATLPETDSRSIYHAATRVIMRMVVALFAEARELLPREHPIYHQCYGIEGLYEQLARVPKERLRNQHSAWPRLLALFRLIYEGSHHEALPVQTYRGGLFEPGRASAPDTLARALAVFEDAAQAPTDYAVFEILRLLTRSEVVIRQGRGRKRAIVPVNFADLSSEYIGILYEGLLDYELRRVEHDPIVFLNLGDQPALPLSRLEGMDDAAVKKLVENMKVKKQAAQGSDEEVDEGDASDEPEATSENDADETVEEGAEVVEDEGSEDGDPEPEVADDPTEAMPRALAWARRAVAAADKKRRGNLTPEKQLAHKAELERAANQIIVKLIQPGEWFLVRWGGTRKGSGTFYTRPQLAVPTTQRTLRPLAYDPPNGNADAPHNEWTPKRPEEILAIKVCDPAMGSGSFLVAALRFLTEALFTSLHHHSRIRQEGTGAIVTLAEGVPSMASHVEELLPCRPDEDHFESLLRARLKRHVVERCIYGVDQDALAVELGRLALWVETMDRSLPFDFLDHKLKCGNALVGCWFDQFRDYPIMAWTREAGDKAHNGVHFAKGTGEKAIKEKFKQVKASLETWLRDVVGAKPKHLFEFGADPETLVEVAREKLAAIHAIAVHEPDRKAEAYRALQADPAYRKLKQAFDVWCAIWFWPTDKLPDAVTPLHFSVPSESQRATAEDLRQQYRFFHWELEFPDVFTAAKQNLEPGTHNASAGFSAVIGNPPWEAQKPNSKEFFSNIDPLYRSYGKQEALAKQREWFTANLAHETDWLVYTAHFKALGNFTKWASDAWGYVEDESGKPSYSFGRSAGSLRDAWARHRSKYLGFTSTPHPYRHQGGGDINTFKLFLETMWSLANSTARVGAILPSGLHTDRECLALRREIFPHWEYLAKLDNEAQFFSGLEHNSKFDVIVLDKQRRFHELHAAFYKKAPLDAVERHTQVVLTHEEIARLSPETLSVPEVHSPGQLRLLLKIQDLPARVTDDLVQMYSEFHMDAESKYFKSSAPIPLYQGAMIWHFDYRYNYWDSKKGDWARAKLEDVDLRPNYPVRSRYWVTQEDYQAALGPGSTVVTGKQWMSYRLVFRRQTSLSNQRSFVCSLLPPLCATADSTWVCAPLGPRDSLALLALFSSFAFDFVIRSRVTSNVSKFILEQCPFPETDDACKNSMARIAARLYSTGAHALLLWQAVSPALGLPAWRPSGAALTPHERVRLRSALDAIAAVAFNLSDSELAFVLASFPGVDRKKPAELRHTVLTLVAFHDLQDQIRQASGDTKKGIEAFCNQNNGEGWMLPETLRLADYGLGHDDRAKQHQPVASRLGPRFYDWQLTQSPEESWAECHLHARNILGETGYQQLLAEIAGREENVVQPVSAVNVEQEEGALDLLAGPKPLSIEVLSELEDESWQSPPTRSAGDVMVALAAALKAAKEPTPMREIRLATLLSLEPRLLTPFLTAAEAKHWIRLIGDDAKPLPPGLMQMFPIEPKAWNQAVAQHRANKRLVEDLSEETWAPGEALQGYETAGWPDGRAGMALNVLKRVTMETLLSKLSQPALRFVNGEAA